MEKQEKIRDGYWWLLATGCLLRETFSSVIFVSSPHKPMRCVFYDLQFTFEKNKQKLTFRKHESHIPRLYRQ